MDNHIFRSAISGFNRQDVMEYIERTQKEAAERAAALESQLEELRRSWEESQQMLEECQQEKEGLDQQLSDMTERFDQAKKNCEEHAAARHLLQQDVEQRDAAIRELTKENQDLLHRVQLLEEQVAAARSEKEQVAQLELEARERAADIVSQAEMAAQALLSQARAEADQTVSQAREAGQEALSAAQSRSQAIQEETVSRVEEAMQRHQAMLDAFEAAAAHITAELRKMDVTVAQLPLNFDHLSQGLGEVLGKAKE